MAAKKKRAKPPAPPAEPPPDPGFISDATKQQAWNVAKLGGLIGIGYWWLTRNDDRLPWQGNEPVRRYPYDANSRPSTPSSPSVQVSGQEYATVTGPPNSVYEVKRELVPGGDPDNPQDYVYTVYQGMG